jgi:crotonobetainyl-CoA:carnitine CoA-transferase CaiB-like acyl-CoA transferase
MKSQETLSKIMELLNLQDEVKLESMKLENGTVIEAEAFEPNQEVFIVTEDERIALPIGEYEMEDGRILVVAEEGVIAEIGEAKEEEAPQEEAPATEEEASEEVEANEEEKEEEMAYATKEELTAAMDELKGMIDEIKSMMSPKEEEMSEEVVEEQVEMSTDEPAAKPIKHSPETKTAEMHKFGKGARKDTLSRIFDKLG